MTIRISAAQSRVEYRVAEYAVLHRYGGDELNRLVVAFAVMTSGCVPTTAIVDDRQRLWDQWQDCLAAAYDSHRRSGTAKKLAAETAFGSCQTDERALLYAYSHDAASFYEATRVVNGKKPSLTARLMSS